MISWVLLDRRAGQCLRRDPAGDRLGLEGLPHPAEEGGTHGAVVVGTVVVRRDGERGFGIGRRDVQAALGGGAQDVAEAHHSPIRSPDASVLLGPTPRRGGTPPPATRERRAACPC